MNTVSLILLIVFLWALLVTKQIFWIVIAGLLFLAYLLTIVSYSTGHGIRKVGKKARAVYQGEIKEMEAVQGKYPAKFFDSVGKGMVEKVNEYQAPKGAKSYRHAQNFRWALKQPMDKIGESAQKILDGLSKLFSK